MGFRDIPSDLALKKLYIFGDFLKIYDASVTKFSQPIKGIFPTRLIRCLIMLLQQGNFLQKIGRNLTLPLHVYI